MLVYDITVPLGPETPIWDDGTGPKLRAHRHFDRGDSLTVTSLAMGSHSGTHTDAPAHFARGGITIDEIPPATLVGPARVVEHGGADHITAEDLDALGVTSDVDRLLIKTPTGRLWERPGFQRDFIGLAPSGGQRLIELGVKLVGIDYLSIESYDASESPVHVALCGAGVVIVEGLDLREVPVGDYLLACAPIKLVGAEGAPTRAFLVDLGG